MSPPSPVRRRSFVLLTVVVGLLGAPGIRAEAAAQSEAIEVRVLELINEGRSGVGRGAEVLHLGLRSMARRHSSDQAREDRLNHDGFDGRVNGAAPDPAESNGPPDDGFRARCENVAYYSPGGAEATVEQVARKLYEFWYESNSHRECMFDSGNKGLNVAGVGVHYRSSTTRWWATFVSVRDTTPPKRKPAASWKRVEETSSAVTYSRTWPIEIWPLQTWPAVESSSASGGSYRQSTTTGASARYEFHGKGVRWIGTRWPRGGIADVRLDGKLVATVDQYSTTTSWQKVLFQRTGLAPGSHTLEIAVRGTKNADATDARTVVDAFERLA